MNRITPLPSDSRSLTAEEISQLKEQGCRAKNWNLVEVGEPFVPSRYCNVEFLGRATISNVTGCLQNLIIEDNVTINGVFAIACDGTSSFGNGVVVNVISETGGREVVIHTKLTAPAAYMQAFYRHSVSLTKSLRGMAIKEADSHRADRGRIGAGSVITNCGELLNVNILGKSRICGALRLTNGTVRNGFVGAGVIAEDFIILDDAKVDSAARLHGAFVGQAATVSNGFAVHDSLIFANSTMENGEAAAVFAGPFTTTMHKSTLLIGGLFSFFNAGSATNQSNHMYKLGPMHQGTLARGSKTGSGSYMLWPAAIGSFTVVNGRHYRHPDTRDYPFSYLINGSDGESVLIPAASLGSVGLARDVEKWALRDKRDPNRYRHLDPINDQWLSPYTMQSVLRGLQQLESGEYRKLQGCRIPESAVDKAIRRYRMICDLFTGGVFRRRILNIVATNPEITPEQLLERLRRQPDADGTGWWADLAGMLAPRREIDKLIEAITANSSGNNPTSGAISDVDSVNRYLNSIGSNYSALSWSWTVENLSLLTLHSPLSTLHSSPSTLDQLTLPQLAEILSRAAEAAEELENLFRTDAAKEFDVNKPMASLSFGIDAEPTSPAPPVDEPQTASAEPPALVDDSQPAPAQEFLDDFAQARGSIEGQRYLAQLRNRVLAFTNSLRATARLLQGN